MTTLPSVNATMHAQFPHDHVNIRVELNDENEAEKTYVIDVSNGTTGVTIFINEDRLKDIVKKGAEALGKGPLMSQSIQAQECRRQVFRCRLMCRELIQWICERFSPIAKTHAAMTEIHDRLESRLEECQNIIDAHHWEDDGSDPIPENPYVYAAALESALLSLEDWVENLGLEGRDKLALIAETMGKPHPF